MPVTHCAVCDKVIEVTAEDFEKETEPLCEDHKESEEVEHE